MARLLVVEEAPNAMNVDASAYWWASVSLPMLESINPRGFGRYIKRPGKERTWLLSFIILAILMLVLAMRFAHIYLGPQEAGTVTIPLALAESALAGGLAAAFFGAPVCVFLNKTLFKVQLLYVVWRIRAESAATLGLPVPTRRSTPYRLLWAEESLYHQLNELELQRNLTDMSDESTMAIWRMEMLSLGVEGYAADRYLRALGANKKASTSDDARGGGEGAPPGSSSSPSGRNAPPGATR